MDRERRSHPTFGLRALFRFFALLHNKACSLLVSFVDDRGPPSHSRCGWVGSVLRTKVSAGLLVGEARMIAASRSGEDVFSSDCLHVLCSVP